ncbi:MAG: type I pullulanase, partial [Eubacteriales bacterium]|nr:type I pullulanase [Eubacteriales bacterium]
MDIKGFKTHLEWKKIFISKEFEEEYTYLHNDLGNTYSKEKTTFKVWAPTAESVILNLYTTGSDNEENAKNINNYIMTEEAKGVWAITINEDLKNLYYTYTITANGKTQETNDINAKACGVNGIRSMIIDLEETNPEDWENDKSPNIPLEERIIYELHIKDFSYNENSGIDEKYRGKYLAFTQKGTSLYGDSNYPTGIDYLKSLGITYVHLLPFYDFGSIDEEKNCLEDFNWGYDPVNYNVPEGSYATDAFDGKTRIKETKEMIKALHNEGIGVIMDVVYNHTYSIESNFNKTVPYYYYRINENGEYCNGSACGNETASDNIMYRQYMINSTLYWAKEYHIDGFRFDLMGIHDTETMNEIRKALDKEFGKGKILIYGEPWYSNPVLLKDGNVPAIKENIKFLDENISAFCDVIRDLIKGNVFNEKNCGYVNSNGKNKVNLKQYLMKIWKNEMLEDFTGKFAKQFINYVSAHDNLTLWDKLIITNNKEPNFKSYDKDLIKQNKLAVGIIFTTCGIPFFQAGEEFARTKEGDENSYNSSPNINALDWQRTKEFKELVEYYKELINIRKELPILTNGANEYISDVHI